MLENWLAPVPSDLLKRSSGLPSTALFHQLRIHTTDFKVPNIESAKVVLIGVNARAANPIREALYPLIHSFGSTMVADLGNVRNQQTAFLIPLLKELIGAGSIPVLIGANASHIPALYHAFQEVRTETSMMVVDERIAFQAEQIESATDYLQELVFHPTNAPFHIGFIGTQIHYLNPEVLAAARLRHYEIVRLGQVRANLAGIEPVIRDADLLTLNLSALRASDCMGIENPTPNGFSGEEMCQICRYAGMSDKLRTMGIIGYHPEADTHRLSAQLQAQMMWYFLEGVHHRKNDFPVTTEGMVEYIVPLKQLDYQLTFWKSKRSGRWWLQVPVKTKKQHQRHRLIPCSYEDYQLAGQDQLPDRLLEAFRRFP
jgi:formiminoglutamase